MVWAGVCRRDAIGLRRLKKRLGARVVVEPSLEREAAHLAALAPDLLVSWFWTKKIPRSVLAVAPGFGVHPSLLPRHRGPDPTFWAIERADAETGVTAHVLDEEYDTGAIYDQERLAIDPAWSSWTLAKKLDRPSLAVLRRTARALSSASPPVPRPQDEALATEAPAPDDAMLELRWSQPAADVVRRIRAASPWPGAFTEIGEHVVTITRAEVTADVPRALAPGEACVRADGLAVVRAADGGVVLLAGRIDDEDCDLDASALAAIVDAAAKR